MAMDELGMARDVLGMEERRVERAEACRRLHEVKLDGGSHEMLSALARAVMPGGGAWTADACERLRAHLVWLLGAGMPEIQALGEDVDKQSMSGHGGPQIGSQGFEENRMSITEELREWARQFRCIWVDPHSGDLTYITNEHACPPSLDAVRLEDYITAIADRIDAEHERTEQDLIDANNQMEQLCECSIELPVDADGEPWRLGDELMMEGEVCEVVGIGGKTIFYAFGDGVEWTIAHNNRHYHAPTVEDVLREFAAKLCIRDGFTEATEKTFAEYAAKLQLREVDE